MSTAILNSPSITTIMAELNVIKIGNKQMTISVFNQLYEEECWDKNHNITQPVWGKVLKGDTEYLIFQKGSELRKIELPSRKEKPSYEQYFFKKANWAVLKELVTKGINYQDRVAVKLADDLTSLGYSANGYYINYKDKVQNVLTEMEKRDPNIFDSLKQDYRSHSSNLDKYNKMVEELKGSKQIFIAV